MAARTDTIIISKLAATDPQGKRPRHIHRIARRRRQQQWQWWPHMSTTRPWARAPSIFISRRAAATVGWQGLMREHTKYSHCIAQWQQRLWWRRGRSQAHIICIKHSQPLSIAFITITTNPSKVPSNTWAASCGLWHCRWKPGALAHQVVYVWRCSLCASKFDIAWAGCCVYVWRVACALDFVVFVAIVFVTIARCNENMLCARARGLAVQCLLFVVANSCCYCCRWATQYENAGRSRPRPYCWHLLSSSPSLLSSPSHDAMYMPRGSCHWHMLLSLP